MASRYYRPNRFDNIQTNISLVWSNMLGMYVLKFDNIRGNWDQIHTIIMFIKQYVPSIDRDYDIDTKTWYINEKYISNIKVLIDGVVQAHSNTFNFVYAEKSKDQVNTAIYTPNSTLLETFHKITTVDISNTQEYPANEEGFKKAKKIYLRTCMYLHPDKNPGDIEIAKRMSQLNVTWDNLCIQYFKTKQLTSELVEQS